MDFKQLDDLLIQFIAMGVPGCDCSVFHKGSEVFRRQYGFSDPDARIPVNGKERYFIYSCSKPITCVAALQLWEKGLFKLDDRLEDYMPEFRTMKVRTSEGTLVPAKNPITIRHLFTMTAGFDYRLASPSLCKAFDETNGSCPTRETMKYLAQEPLCFEPGTSWQYSLCHDVLAAFTEVVSGLPFEKLVEQNIFGPLGMKNSTFRLPASELPAITPLFYNSARGILPRPAHSMMVNSFIFGAKYASGGAGAVSTVDDYMKFLEAWRTDTLIKPETRRMMLTDQLSEKTYPQLWLDQKYTYGLGVRIPKDDRAGDFGWGGAAGAFLAVIPELEVSIFHAQHLLSSPNQGLRYNILDCVTKAIKGS